MPDVDVVVVGAGFAGLYQLHRLRGLGLRTRVVEAGSGVGGTWFWNRYPGARCDVESLEYSYSFSPELEQEWEWSERYPAQPEILRYVEHVADRFDLRRDVAFDTRVTAATWQDDHWEIETDAGGRIAATYCVFATGCLSVPKEPDLPGVETFAGPTYSTARWPHEGVDLTGRRVAVVGTGSSGVQSIPVIAEQAARLTVFQRTANYVVPARNGPLEPAVQQARKADYPRHRQAARESVNGLLGTPSQVSALSVDEAERTAAFERAWERGGLSSFRQTFGDLGLDLAANDTAAEFIRSKIREVVDDPETAEALGPRDHPFGTKRPCLDTGYFETYNRPHVRLVDLHKTPIEEITPTGVRTTDELVEVDDLVLATGFDAMTGALLAVDVTGRDGRRLRDEWAHGPRTYLGLGVAGFPNLFTITGPQSPSVLSNMLVSIEQHVDWVTDCLATLAGRTIEAEEQAQDRWVAHNAEAGAQTLMGLANSWYLGANVPGKPRVLLPYTGGVGPYREICDAVAAKGYAGFRVTETA
ncbi:flavin-containing monooxygenase [Pseudonocardia pini]|uniref:flavin-containing monooxygenase n=1 Tax=Pseudonocardia pini TaxID=2758030 RepID=UPI0015F04E38|nr:NAD(P)/FAD-dependent oxidoreductase [Pseudonocardia pini]